MTDANTLAEQMKQWRVGGASLGAPLLSKPSFGGDAGRNYSLWNNKVRLYAQHENQTFGINLGFTDNDSAATEQKVRRWFFTSNAGDTIHYGDVIAIGNGGDPSFIFNKHRATGVDLEYKSSAVSEWQLLGGSIGQPVLAGDTVALFNTHNQLPLIHFKRTAGGEFGWPDSQTWAQQIGLDVGDLIPVAVALLKAL